MGENQVLAEAAREDIFFSGVSRAFYTYWESLAARCGGVPRRDDFDPAAIPALLPHIFIVEKIKETGRFFFRLSGTGIREIMGSENTNHFLDELLHGEDLDAVGEIFDQVLTQGVCVRSIEGLTYSDRSYLRVEIVRLPLSRGEGERRLVVGCLSRIENGASSGTLATVKDKQVLRIENDVLPRLAF
ncbi:PAS domain-containing protein [Pelagibius marinus]|uniref:PAS domain-containing protein n=1 Tax=Pelagibius marinus TaxID=2762760 RepID=UPI0018725E27|nr:PAS domain-containing protein [Pelagibius marinus]